jgi:hypothetical protein
MENKELLLSGNAYFDIVVSELSSPINGLNSRGDLNISLGGIFNISKRLEKLGIHHCLIALLGNPISQHNISQYLPLSYMDGSQKLLDYRLQFSREEMCEAVIIVHEEESSRTSIVKNGISRNLELTFVSEFGYHHISYIDNLPKYDSKLLHELRESGQFISVDLCLNDPTAEEVRITLAKLSSVSLVIMSDSEFIGLFGTKSSVEAVENLPLGIRSLIVHREDGIIIKDLETTIEVFGKRKPYARVLGMGDVFIAHFYSVYLSTFDIVESAQRAFWELQREVWIQ